MPDAPLTTYEDLLTNACHYTGRVRSKLTAEEELIFRGFIQNRLKEIWLLKPWHQVYKITAVTVTDGKLVLTDFQYLPDIIGLYTVDPTPGVKAPGVPYQIRENGEVYVETDESTLYMEHRERPPIFQNYTEYVDSQSYVRNDVIIWTDGNLYRHSLYVTVDAFGVPVSFYTATNGVDPDASSNNPWNLIEIPLNFADYTALQAARDMCFSDSQFEKGRELLNQAKEELYLQISRLEQQNQRKRTVVLTR